MGRARAEGSRAACSLTTQFAVGESDRADRELLETVDRAHRELDLKRAYFCAFHPSDRSPFANLPAEDLSARCGSKRSCVPWVSLPNGRHCTCCSMIGALARSCAFGSGQIQGAITNEYTTIPTTKLAIA